MSRTALAALVALTVAAGLFLAISPGATSAVAAGSLAHGHSLLQSRELWATVDVCNPAHERNTIGIRGSMPSDGHVKDTMLMRFQLQYRQTNGVWVDLAHAGDSGFIGVGVGKTARQGGTSFQLKPVAGQPAYTMRGLVTYLWKRGGKVVHETTRTTTAGHRGVANADPPGYSAAQCSIS